MPDDDIPRRVLRLLLELLSHGDVPGLVAAGAWALLTSVIHMRATLARQTLELELFGIAAARLKTNGSGGDWVVRF